MRLRRIARRIKIHGVLRRLQAEPPLALSVFSVGRDLRPDLRAKRIRRQGSRRGFFAKLVPNAGSRPLGSKQAISIGGF